MSIDTPLHMYAHTHTLMHVCAHIHRQEEKKKKIMNSDWGIQKTILELSLASQ